MSLLLAELVRTLDAVRNGDILEAEGGFLSSIGLIPKARSVVGSGALEESFARARPLLPDFVEVKLPPSLVDLNNILKLLFFWVMAERIIPVDWRTFKEESEDMFFEYSRPWIERWKKEDPASYGRMFGLLKGFDIDNRKFYSFLSKF